MALLDQNGQPLRDPASAVLQRKYALAQALQKQGMDTSPVVGTGNTTMQAIARVLQAGVGTFLGQRAEGEAQAMSDAQKAEAQRKEALILGLSTGQTPGAAPLTDRLGGAPPVEGPAPVPQVQQQPLPAPSPGGAPADLMPHFEEASRATGVPVPLLVAQAKQESGFRPDATGRAGEVGLMQVMPSTARQPGFGMQGVDPAALRDPRANIMFGAQYLAARNPGVDWNNPQQRDAGLGRYNGGGDPNYAANVTRNLPGAAARTGGTDMAGPGIPSTAPASAPAAAPQAAGGRSPEQLRTAAAQIAALGGTAAQAQALYAQADAIERRQFQTESTAETRRLQEAAAAERRQAREVDDRRADEGLKLQREAAARAAEAERRAAAADARAAGRDGVPANFERDPDNPGATRPIRGGPADPAVIKAAAEARGEGRGGRVIPGHERNSMVEASTRIAETTALRDTFKPEFGGFRVGMAGDIANAIGRNTPGESPRADWWSRYQSQKNQVRNQLFGASLTPGEQSEYEKADINPGMSVEAIRTNLARQAEIISTAQRRRVRSMAADGYNPRALFEASGIDAEEAPATPAAPAAAAPAAAAVPPLPPGFTVVR